MLHATPSLGLAKFLWSKPVPSKPAGMTVSANGTGDSEVANKPAPMKIDATGDNNVVFRNSNGADQSQNMSDVRTSSEGDSDILKIAGLRDFWNHQMKTQEDKWKQHHEQIMSSQRNIEAETAEVDWKAVREKIARMWQSSHEKPEDMSSEEWQKLQELRTRPWLIYKHCELYSRMFLDPESRPIFQEFDFY